MQFEKLKKLLNEEFTMDELSKLGAIVNEYYLSNRSCLLQEYIEMRWNGKDFYIFSDNHVETFDFTNSKWHYLVEDDYPKDGELVEVVFTRGFKNRNPNPNKNMCLCTKIYSDGTPSTYWFTEEFVKSGNLDYDSGNCFAKDYDIVKWRPIRSTFLQQERMAHFLMKKVHDYQHSDTFKKEIAKKYKVNPKDIIISDIHDSIVVSISEKIKK